MLFRVSKSKFSMNNLENSRCNILSLFLLRKNANLSRLVLRNLNESINQFYRSSFIASYLRFLVLMTFLNEMYFSFVIGSMFTYPSYASYVAISLMIKCAS